MTTKYTMRRENEKRTHTRRTRAAAGRKSICTRCRCSEGIDTACEYQNGQRTATILARRFALTYHQQYTELLDEALGVLAIVITAKEGRYAWNSRKSRLSTWVYTNIYYHLLSYCTRRHPYAVIVDDPEDTPTESVPWAAVATKPSWGDRLRTLWQELSDDARIVLQIVLNAPSNIMDDMVYTQNGQRARGALLAYLRGHMGWTEGRIEQTWTEVAACL